METRQDQMQVGMLAGVLAVGLAVIGAGMQLATVSLLTGDSIYWIGAALAILGAGLSFLSHRLWIKIVSLALAVLCVVSVVSAEHQLNERRDLITSQLSR